MKEEAESKAAGEWFYEFKSEFTNSKDRSAVIDRLFREMDTKRFSVYFMVYDKLPKECKEELKTLNQFDGFFRYLEGFNRDVMSVHGIYGVEGCFDLKGVWMWKSPDVHEKFQDHPAYEYYVLTKLDLSKPEDQKRVKAYWLNQVYEQEVEGQKVFQVKMFK